MPGQTVELRLEEVVTLRTRGSSGQWVELTLELVASRMHMSMTRASEAFGVSRTAFKQACRRLGIKRWPFRRGPQRRRFCAVEVEAEDSTRGAVEAEAEDSTRGANEADLWWLLPARAEEGSELWFLGIDYSTKSADVDAWFARDGHTVMGKK